MISVHNQVLSKYHDLEIMGFGLNRLQFLWTTVREIARENNINPEEAVTKFLSDVERQYNDKLGFASKVESLRSEVNKLNQEEARLHTELTLLPLVGNKLVKLTQSGVTEQDIIDIAAVLEKYIAGKDRQLFISELESYGSLKSAIQELSKESERMKAEVTSLETRRRYLSKYNQIIRRTWRIRESRNISLEVKGDSINTLEDELAGVR
jgi:cell division protein FtsB